MDAWPLDYTDQSFRSSAMKKIFLITAAIILIIPLAVYFLFPQVLLNYSAGKARKAAGLIQKSITIDNHTVEYLEGGSGDVAVLLHGLGGDKDNWAAFAKTITPKYRVIALDLPGSGESTKIITELYNIKSQTARLEKIATALKLDKFHLVGNDTGSVIAGRYAAVYPGRVLSLAMFNTDAVPSPVPSEFDKLVDVGKNPLSVKSVDDFDSLLKFMFVSPPSIPGPIKGYLTAQSIKNGNFNQKIFYDAYSEDYRLTSDLSKIKAKTLVLWGDKDKRTHVSSADVIKKALPGCKVIIFKDCGHFPMREKPDESAREYLTFVK
jgi:abhydrolase domain-containing protein 6